MERPRIKLPGREFTFLRKRFGIRFFLHVKCADTRLFVYRCTISDKFFLLFAALQTHVGLQQTINQLPLLILSMEARGSGQEQPGDYQQFSHGPRLPKLRCVCKANCQPWPLTSHLVVAASLCRGGRRVPTGTATQRRGYNLTIVHNDLAFCCL